MSGYPVTCIHFADKDAMIDASMVISRTDDTTPYLCDHTALYITFQARDGVKAAGWLAEAGIATTLTEHRDADEEEARLFISMRDAPDMDYPGEPDGTYARAWGGIMV